MPRPFVKGFSPAFHGSNTLLLRGAKEPFPSWDRSAEREGALDQGASDLEVIPAESLSRESSIIGDFIDASKHPNHLAQPQPKILDDWGGFYQN